MPMLVRLFSAAILLVAVAAGPALAQVRQGSYLATCTNVREVAGWLKATCQTRSGHWVEATTAVGWCAQGSDIANEDGRLVCKTSSSFGPSAGLDAEPAPPGSYRATCRDIRMFAGWLKASCQDSRGRWVDATTAASWCTAGRDIANIDGRLTCR
ncbi:CVNH domain-containing protein [Roseixanthobacter liquoris]|uniref:CVNH domain-containing protein n=1 Tax=Roseixanthobacter liquoris TaxID=3119921 RepID=UPI00372C2A4E